MKAGIRFNPPKVVLSPEVCWVLRRAFGPVDGAAVDRVELNADEALDLARRFRLAERIGVRVSAAVLDQELGGAAASAIHEATMQSAVLSMLVERACREIADAAPGIERPVIFLKGAAMALAGLTAAGSRSMCDVDVLVAEDKARQLQRVLVGQGSDPLDVPESDHQLQLLAHPSGIGIEVHVRIPGVRIDGDRSARAGDVLEAGLCRRAVGLVGEALIPQWDLLLAHCLVHGLAQHGLSPGAYPMARMLADVQDLSLDQAAWRRFERVGIRWIEHDVSADEVTAVREVVEGLARGGDPAQMAAGDGPSAVLLRHLVAGAVDSSYRSSLKFRSLTAKPKDVGQLRGFATTLRHTLFPNRAQIDILYGTPRGRLGYWGWRLWRPFDLVLRTLRYGRAWLQQQRRRGGE